MASADSALTRLRALEKEYEAAARAAGAADARRAALEKELERARRLATFKVIGGARGAVVSQPLASLPASHVELTGRALEWKAAGGGASGSVPLEEITGVALGQRARLGPTLVACACFLLAVTMLVLGPLRWPRPAVLVGAFAGFFVLAAAGAAIVLSSVTHHLAIRTARGRSRAPLDADDVVAEGGRPCNADRFLAAVRQALEASHRG